MRLDSNAHRPAALFKHARCYCDKTDASKTEVALTRFPWYFSDTDMSCGCGWGYSENSFDTENVTTMTSYHSHDRSHD